MIGDALVALFGAPVAHEDDAERAVRAALRMQERLAEMREEDGIDVHLRIGVNTGEVLVGALARRRRLHRDGRRREHRQPAPGGCRPGPGRRRSHHPRRRAAGRPVRAARADRRPGPGRAGAGVARRAGASRPRATGTAGSRPRWSAARARSRCSAPRSPPPPPASAAHLVLVTGEAGRRQVPPRHRARQDRRVRAGRSGAERPVHPVRRDERVVADRRDGRRRVRGRPHRCRGDRFRACTRAAVQGVPRARRRRPRGRPRHRRSPLPHARGRPR